MGVDTLQQRIAELMASMKWSHGDLMRVSGQSSSVVSQWRGVGSGKQTRSIGKIEAAQALQAASGFSALWIAKGIGPKRVPNWTSEQHPSGGLSIHPEAQDMSQPQPDHEPQYYTWEFMVSAVISALPKRFRLAMPDEAMAPDTPRGTVLVFSTDVTPAFGHGVLVQDQAGQRHVRRYAQGPAGRWKAEARNSAYLTLDSADGLQVLAVVVGRETREI